MRTVYAQKNKKIILGRQGEDKAVRVVWPGIVSDWSSLYGDGSFQLSVRRFGDENAYPVVVEVNGDDISFTVTSAETAIAGIGKCELTYIANGTIAKSATWETVVLNSLTGQTPSEPPEEPARSWFTSIQGQIGNLADLATASKDNLVAAINEAAQSGGGGGASVELDTTLTQSGQAADAKAVGDALAEKQPKGDYLTKNELPDMTAYRTAEAQDVIDAGKQDTLIQSGAAVGQIAKITAVDDTGKPTAWQAVDMPSGGGGSGWREVIDYTVDAEMSALTITTDKNGLPFNLREAVLFIEAVGNAETETFRFVVSTDQAVDVSWGSVTELFIVPGLASKMERQYYLARFIALGSATLPVTAMKTSTSNYVDLFMPDRVSNGESSGFNGKNAGNYTKIDQLKFVSYARILNAGARVRLWGVDA